MAARQTVVAVLLLSILASVPHTASGKTTGPLKINPHSGVNFGSQVVGMAHLTTQPKGPRKITISNATAASISLTFQITGPAQGDFTPISNRCLAGPLLPGAKCEYMVTFTPGKVGRRTATLMIGS
jgi:hypothetical protein